MPEPSIPHIIFSNPGRPKLHFAHANGYPPSAYNAFLQNLKRSFEVTAMEARPLWPGAQTNSIQDWRDLEKDLVQFLSDQGGSWLGVGHSVGGTVTLMAALARPDLFRAIVIMDPPLFTPLASILWRLALAFKLEGRINPLIRSARRRKRRFMSRQAMFENYRQKSVFRKMDDAALMAYVESLAEEGPDGSIHLRYSPDWEARIYSRAMLADTHTWKRLPSLQIPALFIRAERSNAFSPASVEKIKQTNPKIQLVEIPGATHLFPLENPEETADIVQKFFSKIDLQAEKLNPV